MNNDNLKILIVDDEKPARKKITSILKVELGITNCIEAENGSEGVELILKENPDLIFLDIQMPGLTGFDLIKKVGAENMPAVIFVTAYDQYAIEAFEVQAVDYLLKPYDRERLIKAFNIAAERIDKKEINRNELEGLLKSLTEKKEYRERIMIKDGYSHFFISSSDIIFIKANDKYLDIITSEKKYIIRDTLTEMGKQLNPSIFKRANKSAIVNIDFIKEVQPFSHGDYTIIMKNKEKLKLSRNFVKEFFG